MELFDTHAHLDDEQFHGELSGVVQRGRLAGVATILTVGTTRASSETSVHIASQFPQIYAAVGIQPHCGAQSTADDWDHLVELARNPRVRAIGETGLDAHWDVTPFDVQQRLFAAHLRLSQETGLPVIVHMRDCGVATVEMLVAARARGPLCGVMHSFTGTADIAWQCLALGLHVSFSGIATFKKSGELREIARMVPADRIVIETDSPYLAPHPYRGKKPNEPTWLVQTAQCLADARGVPLDVFAESTTANARRLFGTD